MSWIVAGGGARNLTFVADAAGTSRTRHRRGGRRAWAGRADAIEAQAFGFLAARGLKGLPLSYPATTGVPFPMTGGVIARP